MNSTRLLSACVVALGLVAIASPARAQHDDDDYDRGSYSQDSTFSWKGEIATGGTIRIMDLNGGVDVDASNNGTTSVTAVKRWRHSDPSRVRIVTEPGSDGMTVCAIWDDSSTSCDGHEHEGSHEVHNNDVSVHFTVHVAKGVKVDLETVNGSIDVQGATVAVNAHTVNGRVDIATLGGPVTARTTNGSVHATIDHLLNSNEPLELTTVNGSVELDAPAQLNAALDAATVNGSVSTDFPILISSLKARTRLRGTIGQGGRELRLHTVNGSVTIKKLG